MVIFSCFGNRNMHTFKKLPIAIPKRNTITFIFSDYYGFGVGVGLPPDALSSDCIEESKTLPMR